MNFLVFCTFDLKGASSTDYASAYSDLAAMGLKRVHVADSGSQVVIPTTSAMGLVDGASAGVVRDDVAARVARAFAARRLQSEIFVSVGGSDWAWGGRTT